MRPSRTLPLISFFTSLLLYIALTGCDRTRDQRIDEATYRKEFTAWQEKRITNLKGPAGWLNVAGLFWLKPGPNTFGSAETNDIVFPEGKILSHAGLFRVVGDSVYVTTSPNAGITLEDGSPVTTALIYTPDSLIVLKHDSLQWFIIKRGPRLGVRLRDLQHENLAAFSGIDAYPLDLEWRVEATFAPHDSIKHISITDITGTTTEQESPGTLTFKLNDTSYRLDVLGGGDNLFIIFADETNGVDTYGSGRFVYAALPGLDGKTVLDFNKSINPPCAFTAYATCPLPPAQNHLAVKVTAGEKDYHLH